MGTADIDRGQGISICQFILSDTQIINSLLSSPDIYITSEPVSDWTTFYGICCFLEFEISFYGFELSHRMPASLLIYVLLRTRVWVRLSLPQSLRSNVYEVKNQVNKKLGWSQCWRFLRRESAMAGFLELRVRIPPRGIDMSPVGVVRCQVGVSASDPSPVHRSPTGCVVWNLVWSWSFDNEEYLVQWGKGKAVPLQAWGGPEGSSKLRFPDFMTTTQDGGKVVSLTHRPLLPPGNTPGTHFR